MQLELCLLPDLNRRASTTPFAEYWLSFYLGQLVTLHGILVMESPERKRNECIPTPVDPGSPFFEYLCGLSPIKPSRSVHLVQTYAELSLPPPPAVFTSPPNLSTCGGAAKRGLVVHRAAKTHVSVEAVEAGGNAWGVDKYNYNRPSYMPKNQNAAPINATCPACHMSLDHSHHHIHCKKLDQKQTTGASGMMPSRFSYADVADYLDDPPEGEMYGVSSTSLLQPKQETNRSSPNPHSYGFAEGDCAHAENNDGNLSPELQDPVNSSQDANIEITLDTVCHFEPTALVWGEADEDFVAKANDPSCEEKIDGSGGVDTSLVVNQETGDMALHVGNGNESCQNNWITAHLAVTEYTEEEMPEFHGVNRASSRERFREDADTGDERTSRGETTDLEGPKDFGVGGNPGQRGVRRRCLDFETSTLRKSMDVNNSGRDTFQRPLSGSTMTTNPTSIPPAILSERAVATSDATNSATVTTTTTVIDTQSDISLRPKCTSCGNKGAYPGLLRVSQSNFQRNTNFVGPDQSGTEISRVGRDSGNPSFSMGIPSSIGLHLNSLTGHISFSPTNNRDVKKTIGLSSSKRTMTSLLGMPDLTGPTAENKSNSFEKSMVGIVAGSKNFAVGTTTSSVGTGVVISLTERSHMTLREALPVTDMMEGGTDSLQSIQMGVSQSLEGKRLSRANVLHTKFISVGKKRFLQHDAAQESNVECAEEYEGAHCKKRRKLPIAIGDKSGEGCKRCNCKKSKCLKLYCECFAAGSYCLGSCTCHDCFNKPEHEEVVMNTRQQIESRNPLAFAPKIIHMGENSPKHAEEIIETPASARHKRGCNCKKSQCLKKYCECYQAGVGCSEGCRCEGCKNMYGWKEATDDSNEKETGSETNDMASLEDQLDWPQPGLQAGVGNIHLQWNNSKDLSPITPSFQFTWQGRTTGRVRSSGKKRSSSPLSQSQSKGKAQGSPANSSQTPMDLPNNIAQTPDSHHLSTGNSLISTSTPKLSRASQLSPGWDGLVDICTLTPLPHPPVRPAAASISTIKRTGSFSSFCRQSIEPMSSYQPDDFDPVLRGLHPGFQPASDHSSLSSSEGSLSQKSGNQSTSSACLGQENMKVGDISSFLCDDDDTPDFLLYGHNVNSTVITKSSSPKQKRVSPPHIEGMRDKSRRDLPARSPSGLQGGRKFVLKELPSLPPLMPLSSSTHGQAGKCKKLG